MAKPDKEAQQLELTYLEKETKEALANTALIQTAEGRFLANLMLRFMETMREGKPVTPPASRHHA